MNLIDMPYGEQINELCIWAPEQTPIHRYFLMDNKKIPPRQGTWPSAVQSV